MRMSSDSLAIGTNADLRKFEKKRPTLRFSEMIRHDWTTFSRDRAESFDNVELAVYGPWRQLELSPIQLDHFGVSSDILHERNTNFAPTKSRKSTWYVVTCSVHSSGQEAAAFFCSFVCYVLTPFHKSVLSIPM